MRVFAVLGGLLFLVLAGALVFWLSGLGAGTPAPGTKAAISESGKNAEGEYPSNPFEKPTQPPFPKLEVSETTFDFGVMRFPLPKDDKGDPIGDSHVFTVRNTGEGVLKLARGPSTCQCTMSDLQDQVEVPPGGSTDITVTWAPEFATDEFSKGASIWTNDPALFAEGSQSKDGKIMFEVKGQVIESSQIEPGQFSLGTLNEEEPTHFETVVFSRVMPDLQVSVKESSSEFITAEVVPTDEEKLKTHQAVSGWTIKGTIQPKLPVGRVRETLTLATNDPNHPEYAVSIEAQRQGPVSIAGRFWNNAYTMVDFGRFDASKGIETTLSLYTAKRDDPLEIKVVEVRPAGLIVTTEPDVAYADPQRERHFIKVQVPAGRPPERLVSKEAGFVRMELNLPDVPVLEFHVTYESH